MDGYKTLLDLPVDVLFQILSQLCDEQPSPPKLADLSNISSFRLCSSSCHRLAEPFFYRGLSLHSKINSKDDQESEIIDTKQVIDSLIQRLCAPKHEHSISRHVRLLQIGPLRKEDSHAEMTGLPGGLTEGDIVRTIESLDNLTDFT
jgi:hypothetical protein